jgi:cyclic pyranopterin phosphate synthase
VFEQLAAIWPLERAGGQSTHETARRFRYRDGLSEVGFINSVSEPFCRGCDRARISADGMLYTCLFAEKGVSLKEMLREQRLDETALRERIARLWGRRQDRYSEERTQASAVLRGTRPEMWTIGG